MPRDRSGYNRRYYQENRERLIRMAKEYYQKNKEKKKAYMKAYLNSPEGREKRKEYLKKYAKRPEVREADKRRKRDKKEWYRNYHREYYHKNKERINELREKR